MQVVSIKIQSLDDVKTGVPLVPTEVGENLTQAELHTVTILEAGTASKRTSVGLVIDLGDGTYRLAQCTAEMFLSIAGAVKGAVERFEK